MSRRIIKLIALTFAVVLALSGCNLVKIDESIDDKTVVATFDGGVVTKGDVLPAYESNLAYYELLSSYYGYAIPTDGLLEETVNNLVTDKVLLHKAEELGLATLATEETEEAMQEALAAYEDTLDTYWDEFAEEGMTDEEIRGQVEEFMAENDYTLEAVIESYTQLKIINKLRSKVYEGVVVTPEEIQNEYRAMLAADESAYAEDSFAFESAVTTGMSTIAWYPEGYRTVKHILLSFTEEQQADLSDIQLQITQIESQIRLLDEDADPTALQAQLDELKAELEAKTAEYAALLQPQVDEILAAVEAGEDFEKLMEQYNTDPGMESEPAKSEGYYVSAASETWVAGFRDGAMALENIGDVSGAVPTAYGVHIIRYHGDVTPGAVPMDELSEEIEAKLLAEKQTAAYDEQVNKWVEEANVKIDLKVLNIAE
ncbi:MAG: peptidylprolyl isomerase [Eubacteriales bacterium]|nr:peptidylprolyl isomerase [Eubacteriales bacterium]